MVAEARQRAEDFGERFKLAVITADPKRFIPLMFPEWQKKPEEEDDLDEGGTYRFTEPVDPAEAERVLQDLLAESRVSFKAGAVPNGEGGWM